VSAMRPAANGPGIFDSDAAYSYPAWFQTSLGRRVWSDERWAIDQLLGSVRGLRILDAGAGDGRLAAELAARGARVTALDLSRPMLERARERARGDGAHFATVEGDVTTLPFPSATFDRVVSVTVLCFLPDPGDAVREFSRVLVPGGSVVLGELGRWSSWNVGRWLRGRRGDPTWKEARMRSRPALERFLRGAQLRPASWSSAIFYTPGTYDRRGFRTLERRLRGRTTLGAAFLAVKGVKPNPA
jgi:SAM-dependent methyltransferase